MSDEGLIAEAGRRLSEAAPDARVILFGSHARGDAQPGSDLDLLVVEPELPSRRSEFVRLLEALGAMSVPIDLIVVSSEHAERWAPVPGTLMHEASETAVSSPGFEPDRLAAILARKASEDAVAVREFEGNPEIADSILGFHAQQHNRPSRSGSRPCSPTTRSTSSTRMISAISSARCGAAR